MSSSNHHTRRSQPYPMVRLTHRKLAAEYDGPVYIWDVDKTYLDTRFSSLKGLAKIPFEFAQDKKAVPGTVELLRALRRGPEETRHRPLYFVSASPPPLRHAIERKMLLDGVEFDGISYKDPVRAAIRVSIKQIRRQFAYKLSALLTLTHEDLAPGAQLHLFGDDAEADPLIYALFADIIGGRLQGDSLYRTLRNLDMPTIFARRLTQLGKEIGPVHGVVGIYIHLVRNLDGGSLSTFDERMMGWPTTASLARHLQSAHLINEAQSGKVRDQAGPSEAFFGGTPTDPTGFWTPLAMRR